MEVIATLIKMTWWYGRGLPPRRLGFVIYEWGGFSASPPRGMRALPENVVKNANDILAHAEENENILAAAWLWTKPPLALWRLLPVPVPKRRIIYFAEWNKMYVSRDGTLAVKWVSDNCCVALLWSYPWVWVRSRRFFRMLAPAPSARAKL
jgi:hypothetical protein